MTYRLKTFLPILLLLLLLPLHALAEGPVSPLIGESASVDDGKRITILSTEAENVYQWASSDQTVAAVDSRGRVTGKNPGVCTITATATDGTGVTAECIVTVVK